MLALLDLLEGRPDGSSGGASALRIVRVGRNNVRSQALRDRLGSVLAARRLDDATRAPAAAPEPRPLCSPSRVPLEELPAASQGWQLVTTSVEQVAAAEGDIMEREQWKAKGGPSKEEQLSSPAAVQDMATWVNVSPAYAGTTLGSGFELL